MSFMDDCLSPTNTFASTPFDVLKVDGIEDPLIDINKLATIDLQESFFAQCVRFVNESNKEVTDAKLVLYKSLSEAASDTVVLESFSDFFSAIKEIIDKFLKFVKQLIDRFLATIAKFIQSDKFIKKHKDDIRKFNSDCEFEFVGYNYTFDPDIPLSTVALSIADDLFKDIVPNGDLSAEYIKNLNSEMSYDEDFYDEFRAKLLKRDGERISAGDFQEELFRVFRDDSLETEKITVTSIEVNESYRRFDNYSEAKKRVERERKDIERAYNNLKDELKSMTNKSNINVKQISNYVNHGTVTSIGGTDINKVPDTMQIPELIIAFDLYTKNKVDQVQRCSDIHILAYGAKLDAMKECLKQDRALLYSAYNQVRKRGVK